MEMQSGAVHEDALTSAWKHDPTCLLQTWLYRRLLYFANLLLCSAAILKRSKRKQGVDREVTESSCKETDEQERGGWVTSSSATFKGCWKRTDVLNQWHSAHSSTLRALKGWWSRNCPIISSLLQTLWLHFCPSMHKLYFGFWKHHLRSLEQTCSLGLRPRWTKRLKAQIPSCQGLGTMPL